MKRTILIGITILFSCSHHMIKDYTMVTDDNKREYFRVFQKDTNKIFEYCHNNFLPARYQPPAFQKTFWIDLIENRQKDTVSLYFQLAVTDRTSIMELIMENDTIVLNPSTKPYIKKKTGRYSRAYRVYSYSGDTLMIFLEKIINNMNKISGMRTLGPVPNDSIETRAISGVPIVKERYISRFYEFDENEKLGIKNSLELFRDLKRKYKQ